MMDLVVVAIWNLNPRWSFRTIMPTSVPPLMLALLEVVAAVRNPISVKDMHVSMTAKSQHPSPISLDPLEILPLLQPVCFQIALIPSSISHIHLLVIGFALLIGIIVLN